MKKLLLISCLMLLVGCEATRRDVERSKLERDQRIQNYLNSTSGLQDCKFYNVPNSSISIIRCPNSSTTTTISGKFPTNVTVVE